MSGWLTSAGDSNLIEMQGDSWIERISYLQGSVGIGGTATIASMTRVHTPSTIEYIGLELLAAKAFVAANPASETYDSGTGITTIVKSCKWVRDGDAGCYKVIKETETVTAWA
jgi:hypothetical protein